MAVVGTGLATWAWLGLSWATVSGRPGPLVLGLFGGRGRAALAAGAAAVAWVLVYALGEAQEHARLVVPRAAAAPDSRWAALGPAVAPLEVHYKSVEPPDGTGAAVAVAFLHGFGASLFDWTRDIQGGAAGCVLIRTARLLAGRGGREEEEEEEVGGPLPVEASSNAAPVPALLMAYDAPGFGLTQRTRDLRDYAVSRNGALALELLDFGLRTTGMAVAEAHEPRAKRVLVGHSLGALAAAQALYDVETGGREGAQTVDGLVLVSPAILSGAFSHRHSHVPRVARIAGAVAGGIALSAVSLTLWVVAPAGRAVLRALVRSKQFWRQGLAAAFASPASVTNAVVDGYRAAKVVRGWDTGMWRFVRSRVTPLGPVGTVRAAIRDLDRPRLMDVLLSGHTRVPILLVHGTEDAIIPVSNSRAIAAAAAEARANLEFVEVPGTGHNLYLEKPAEFSALLADWIHRCIVTEDDAGARDDP